MTGLFILLGCGVWLLAAIIAAPLVGSMLAGGDTDDQLLDDDQ